MQEELSTKQKKRINQKSTIEQHIKQGVSVNIQGHVSLNDGEYQVKKVFKYSGGKLEGKYYYAVIVLNGKQNVRVGCNAIKSVNVKKTTKIDKSATIKDLQYRKPAKEKFNYNYEVSNSDIKSSINEKESKPSLWLRIKSLFRR